MRNILLAAVLISIATALIIVFWTPSSPTATVIQPPQKDEGQLIDSATTTQEQRAGRRNNPPAAEATLTDQQQLELSALENSVQIKDKSDKVSSIVSQDTIPTTSPRPPSPPPIEDKLAEDDARSLFVPLNDSSKPSQGSDSIYGRSTNRSNNSSSPPTPVASATPDIASLPWVTGQARGYAMLYALHPKARAVVEKQVTTLLKARVREPYVSVLIDGTFGQDFDYFRTVISRLSSQGRRLTLAVYISNGPTMRIWNTTPIKTAFSNIRPSEFRQLIQWQEKVRNDYADLVDQARQLFEFNLLTNRSNKNIAIPMLEDNLDRDSYQAARGIAAAQISSIADFARNPCEGCFDGNDGDPFDDILEEHRIKYFSQLGPGDGFTLDGLGFTYPETTGQTGLNPQKLNELLDASLSRSLSFFGLWRHQWQGVIPGTTNAHPDLRNYVPSNETETEFEISLLRRGLTPEKGLTADSR